ncbi:MAG: hypothetical protein DFNUSKGM_000878 [Candidatus Fervidibacter sacchari]
MCQNFAVVACTLDATNAYHASTLMDVNFVRVISPFALLLPFHLPVDLLP